MALNEYRAEDESGKSKLIYAYFGLAVYQAQCLEEVFSFMIWTNRIIKKNIKTSQEINEIMDSIENSKKTMGNFIHEVKKNYDLSDEVEKFLADMLAKRNYLIHKYFKVEIAKFYSDKGRKEMLHFLSTFVDDALELDKRLQFYQKEYREKLGITNQAIERLMKEMTNAEKSRTGEH